MQIDNNEIWKLLTDKQKEQLGNEFFKKCMAQVKAIKVKPIEFEYKIGDEFSDITDSALRQMNIDKLCKLFEKQILEGLKNGR